VLGACDADVIVAALEAEVASQPAAAGRELLDLCARLLEQPGLGVSPSAHTAPGNCTAPMGAQIQLSRTQNKQVTASRHS
jgi:hypothetical protein